MVDIKADLLSHLRGKRAIMLAKLEGLSAYDRRRPMTPTGTNLLGLVKHLAGLEYGYLGTAFGRSPVVSPSWFRDDPYTEIDMWATPDESSEYIIDVYRRASAHSDSTVGKLDLDSAGWVGHWAVGSQETTLGALLIRMVDETAQHAGHADIIRELIDGTVSNDGEPVATETDFWRDRRIRIQAVADRLRGSGSDDAH